MEREAANGPVVTPVRPTRSRALRLPQHLERRVRHSSYAVLLFAVIGLVVGGVALLELLEESTSGAESVAWPHALAFFGGGVVLLVCFLAARRHPVWAFGVVLILVVAAAVASILVDGPTGWLWFGLLFYVCFQSFLNARQLEKLRRGGPHSGGAPSA